jgi:hypothetical protein
MEQSSDVVDEAHVLLSQLDQRYPQVCVNVVVSTLPAGMCQCGCIDATRRYVSMNSHQKRTFMHL